MEEDWQISEKQKEAKRKREERQTIKINEQILDANIVLSNENRYLKYDIEEKEIIINRAKRYIEKMKESANECTMTDIDILQKILDGQYYRYKENKSEKEEIW